MDCAQQCCTNRASNLIGRGDFSPPPKTVEKHRGTVLNKA
nr:MAG TPA: hypothetical protein [Bacteriophage sp.]